MERATCTGGVTVFTIPESVIGLESVHSCIISVPRIPRLTEVIFSNKWYDWYNTTNVTWTAAGGKTCRILKCSIRKCPDVLSRNAMHYSHTTGIGTVNCSLSTTVIPIEAFRRSPLVGSVPATHLTVYGPPLTGKKTESQLLDPLVLTLPQVLLQQLQRVRAGMMWT